MTLVAFPTSCTSALGASVPPSSVFSSKVFPENFFSQSSSDQTATAKLRVRAQEPNQRATCEHARGSTGQGTAQRWQQDRTQDMGALGWQQPTPKDMACGEIRDKVISSSSQRCHTSLSRENSQPVRCHHPHAGQLLGTTSAPSAFRDVARCVGNFAWHVCLHVLCPLSEGTKAIRSAAKSVSKELGNIFGY